MRSSHTPSGIKLVSTHTVNSCLLTFSQRFCVLPSPPPTVRSLTQTFPSPTEHSDVGIVRVGLSGSVIKYSVQLVTVTRLLGLPTSRAFTVYSVKTGSSVGLQSRQLSDVI